MYAYVYVDEFFDVYEVCVYVYVYVDTVFESQVCMCVYVYVHEVCMYVRICICRLGV